MKELISKDIGLVVLPNRKKTATLFASSGEELELDEDRYDLREIKERTIAEVEAKLAAEPKMVVGVDLGDVEDAAIIAMLQAQSGLISHQTTLKVFGYQEILESSRELSVKFTSELSGTRIITGNVKNCFFGALPEKALDDPGGDGSLFGTTPPK